MSGLKRPVLRYHGAKFKLAPLDHRAFFPELLDLASNLGCSRVSNDRQLAFFAGIAERDRVLANFEKDHPLYIATLRQYAISIATTEGEVATDRLREVMAHHGFPMPEEVGIEPRVMGNVLRGCKELVAVGQRLDSRKEIVARCGVARSALTVYKLRKDVRKEIA